MSDVEFRGTIDAITYTLTSDIKKTIKQLKERGIIPSQEDREVDSVELTKTIIYTGMLVEPTQEQIAIFNELDIEFTVVDFKSGSPKTSKIYEQAVELRELLNKIPDWKIRMSAQFLACIKIGNRELDPDFRRGDQRSLREDVSSLSRRDKLRTFELLRSLFERGKYEFSSTPERYAIRAFIMSVILGQEYTNADAITLINGLREGMREEI